MADEARLHDLLDLVEQARKEGDSDTEAKATAAYKRESSAAPAKPRTFADTLGDIGDAGKRYVSDYASGIGNAAKRWGGAMSFNPVSNTAGTGEAALNTVTGILSNPLALAAKMSGNTRPTADIQKDLTYQPRGEMGQAIVQGAGAITKPVNDIGEIGAKGLSAVTPMNPDTASAVINTGLMAYGARGSKPTPIATSAEATQRAQAYVRNNTSLDWTALPNAIRERLADLAKNQKNLDALDPKAIERQIQLESLPAPITNASKGQLTRDPRQLQQEELLKSTDAGQVLTQDALEQNRKISENIDVLRNKTGGKPLSDIELGRSLQDENLRAKQASAKAVTRAAYKKAEDAGELAGPVDSDPLRQWLDKPINRANSPGLEKLLNDYAKEDGAISVKELEDIRQDLTAERATPTKGAHYAGKAIEVIDSILDNAGGPLYKKARAQHRAERMEFGEQASVERLVEDKTRTDRQTALEDTHDKTVIQGSLESLKQVRDSLLTGGTAKTRANGAQAWKDIAATTIEKIKEAATKGASNQAGEANSTYAALKRAIDRVGDDKLELLIGKDSTAQLRQVLKAAETLKTEPTGIGVRGSNTVNKIMNILDRTLVTKIPVVGDLATGIIKGAAKLHELGKTGREVRAAQTRPLDVPKEYPDLMTPEQKIMAQRAAIAASLSRANQ